ncbi:Glycosyltransferase involved in cell wall bisynthesis [Chitinophaga rupis]|uniref:Glycosyltransferase involved in cell wall bisynthesis n=1 Tax=Chitinophaga rupis TaxID=573321 RepID=A0A1H7RAX4_9BACT|nr:glycosyltransferase family 2 protein [Chitinophaga rupis]SEL57391.1 Glycosyltransferase involved in cell wall bisynthesis [Chitinophaga rupis]
MSIISRSVLQALILTKNEEPNIQRVLDKLTWLERVVVLDSGSTDKTIEILQSYPNVEIQYRAFDSFAQQCNYGLSLIESEWVLSMDADYVLTDQFIEETKAFVSGAGSDIVGYDTRFEFLIYGRQLISNNTTPRTVLFKRTLGIYFDDGHAHRLRINGRIGAYKSRILHDDRKPFSRWLSNQDGYSIKECHKLLDPTNPDRNSMLNKIRRTKIFAPIFVFFYCLIIKRLIFSGWPGWYYTLQRTMVEMLFSLRLMEEQHFDVNSKK